MIKTLCTSLIAFGWLFTAETTAQTFSNKQVTTLIDNACIHCHDDGTDTPLDFTKLGHDLGNVDTFRRWERVYDRIRNGEMPPESEGRPDAEVLQPALASLQKQLKSVNRARQQQLGRVPARRLSKLELSYTLRDLLKIDGDVTSSVPDEVESGSFDTVGATQRISAVHMEGYLKAADEALDRAIQLGRNPFIRQVTSYAWLEEWHEKPLQDGGSVTRALDDGGIALFADLDYLTKFHYKVRMPGMYRLTAEVAAYQSKTPVTAKLILKEPSGGAELLKAVDLPPGKTETLEVLAYMKPGDSAYVTVDLGQQAFLVYLAGGAKHYKGRGLAIKSQTVEGPLFESWPPQRTLQLLHGTKLVATNGSDRGPFQVKLTKPPMKQIADIVQRFATHALRRPPTDAELASFLALAQPALEQGRSFSDAVKIPLRSILSSPQFLMFASKPGELDEYALANRLSYFLWKSMPDDELFALAAAGKLSDPKTLATQVERMLADDKSNRFVRDFLGQWLRLYQLDATTPDDKLYPEYDELLGNALGQETELFFTELVDQNLSLTNLIDSDFTFVNRRLAKHYQLPKVAGQEFRKVQLPEDSPRGGVLTQAAILKTTANGTVTSPVMRGNFVLTNLLGTPPPPPPPSVGSIEPDTRGKTTIREILAAHRDNVTCAKCHREIDPPGFALESFDPIGSFRTRYRATAGSGGGFSLFRGKTYKQGPAVDPSGVMADGQQFSGINEFKELLLGHKEQVARNFVSRLVVYATGGEIQLADRETIEAMLERTREDDFPVRDLIHEVVQSGLFRRQ